MDPETKWQVTDALDRAIAEVAREEFERLCRASRLTRSSVAARIRGALENLDLLRTGRMPNYDDEWVALFYLVWYQPRHINLAYSLLCSRDIPKKYNPLFSGGGALSVVDFGCGALAMEFALTIARISGSGSFQICGIDKSQEMQKLGEDSLNRFCEEYDRYALEKSTRDQFRNFGKNAPRIKWVSSLHVSYEEEADRISQDFRNLVEIKNPDIVLTTSYIRNDTKTFPNSDLGYQGPYSLLNLGRGILDSGELERVTEWRRGLAKKFPTSNYKGYLSSTTTWKIHDTKAQYYVRMRS